MGIYYGSGHTNRGSVSIQKGEMGWKMRGSFKKFDREQQNLVKQLFFNIKFTKKKQTNRREVKGKGEKKKIYSFECRVPKSSKER